MDRLYSPECLPGEVVLQTKFQGAREHWAEGREASKDEE